MADEASETARQLKLPDLLVTHSDVGRLMQEAETVHNFMTQATVRQPGTPISLPKTSQLFNDLVALNQLNLLQPADREYLSKFLQAVRSSAPVIHMSFNTEPSGTFQQKIISWLRKEIHPFVLLQIGLRPNIGAGCVLRTNNKFFDFSLRHRFSEQRDSLIARLAGSDVAAPASAPEEVVSQEASA